MKLPPAIKLLFDLAPLGAFFVGFKLFGLQGATMLLLAVTFATLAITYAVERKIALSPLITGLVVATLGTLTLLMKDEWFIKVKPTLVNLIFAAILFGGLVYKRGLLRYLLEVAFQLTDRGWFVLSRRWAFFFLFLACLNEAVWRSVPTETWVNFKVFGMFTLTLLFTIAQFPLIKQYGVEEKAD